MLKHGLPVPRGFSLDASHYRSFVQPLAQRILAALPCAERIESIFLDAPVTTDTDATLARGIDDLVGVDRFAVRSSGKVFANGCEQAEDDANTSLAGQFESYLNVPRALVADAVRRCWRSLYNQRSIDRFAADARYISNSEMTVLIQEMVPAKACAVMMTADPQGDGKIGAIEAAWGPCEVIVGGYANPDEILFDRQTGTVLSTSIGSKMVRVRYGDFTAKTENLFRDATALSERLTPALSDHEVSGLIKLGRNLEKIFGRPQDVEAVITFAGEIVITQSRPVTALNFLVAA